MENRALIFYDEVLGIGLGHKSRCFALGFLLEKYGFEVEFFDTKDFENALKNAKIIILDSYILPLESYKKALKFTKNLLVFDDTLRLEYPPCAIINPSGEEAKYKAKYKNHLLLLGREYLLLQRVFLENLSAKKEIKENIKNVLITLGSVDICGLNSQVLEILKGLDFKIHMISKESFKEGENLKIYKNLNANEMFLLMQEMDLAICACGQTLLELLSYGVPCIALEVARNQRANLKNFEKCIFSIQEAWQVKNLKGLILEYLERLKGKEKREFLSKSAKEFFLQESKWSEVLQKIK